MRGKRRKTLDKQWIQALAEEGRGEALDAAYKEAEPLMAKPAAESPAERLNSGDSVPATTIEIQGQVPARRPLVGYRR